jgi:hypothetical protein
MRHELNLKNADCARVSTRGAERGWSFFEF